MKVFLMRVSSHKLAPGRATILNGYVVVAHTAIEAVKAYVRYGRQRDDGSIPVLAGVHAMLKRNPLKTLAKCPDTGVLGFRQVARGTCGVNLMTTNEELRDYIQMCHQFERIKLIS